MPKAKVITCCGDCGYYDWKNTNANAVIIKRKMRKTIFTMTAPLWAIWRDTRIWHITKA